MRKIRLASANGNSDSSWPGDECLSLVALPSEYHHPLPSTCYFSLPKSTLCIQILVSRVSFWGIQIETTEDGMIQEAKIYLPYVINGE